MTNLTKPSGFNALSPQQQKEHRARIGLRAEVILSQFWRDDDCSDAARAIEIEGWMDVLESCSQDEIRQAWASYQRGGPRTASGKLCKPDAGAIYRLVMAARPKTAVVRQIDDAPRPAPPCSPEAAQRIMREVFGTDQAEISFAPKKMPGVN